MASSARLDELKKKFDENPRRYFAPLANEHRKSGDLDQAIALCRTHLPQQPGHISGHIVLAQALFEAGTLDESREIFHTALGLDPENLIALRYLGDIAKESSDVETARSWYQRVLEVDPRNDEIVQLVRDLDAPPPAAAEEAVEEVSIDDIASLAPPEAPATPAPQAPDNDARFAPLSLDELDVDESVSMSNSEAAPNVAESDRAPNSYDQHAAWSIDASSAKELPLLDESGLDPFDLDPANSAESLYDPSAAPPSDDIFLTELSGASAPIDPIEVESTQSQDEWASQETVDASSQPAAADNSLEEASFYLEPPPAAPTEQVPSELAPSMEASTEPQGVETPRASSEPTNAAADQMSSAGFDALAAEYYVPVEESRRHSRPSLRAVDAESEVPASAEVSEEIAAEATAEWPSSAPETSPTQSAQAPADDLGLEVMEFVPPATTHNEHIAPPVGFVSEQSAPPAAFVTETMAELYLQQGFRNEALAVYRELLSRNPGDESLRDRIAQIESGSISSIGMASVSEEVVESARRRQTSRPPRSVRSFFASLAGRRAPAPQRSAAESHEVSAEQYIEEQRIEQHHIEEQYIGEQDIAAHIPEQHLQEPPPPAAEPERITPLMSAAETLASYDPFADAADEGFSVAPPTPETTPNVMGTPNGTPEAVAPTARPTPVSMPAQPPVAMAPEPVESAPERRSLEELFPDPQITTRTETAAQTLATAFGRQEPQGRPTRAASNELSLDHVFRGAPEGAPAGDGGFSFDQFFSDSRSSGDVAAPTVTSDTGRSSGSTDAHDIEQFTAWLEGLKKK